MKRSQETSKKQDVSNAFEFIKQNDKKEVSEYIENGGDLEAQEEHGCTLLLYSIVFARIEIALELIEKGADVNNPEGYGHTPLKTAIYAGLKDVILALIEKEARYYSKTMNASSPASTISALESDLSDLKDTLDEGDLNKTGDYIPDPEDFVFVQELLNRNLFYINSQTGYHVQLNDIVLNIGDLNILKYLKSQGLDFSRMEGIQLGMPVVSAEITDFLFANKIKLESILKGSIPQIDITPGWKGIRQALNLGGNWQLVVKEEDNFKRRLISSQLPDVILDSKGNTYELMTKSAVIIDDISKDKDQVSKFLNSDVDSYVDKEYKRFPVFYTQLSYELSLFQKFRALSYPERYQKIYAVNALLQLGSTCKLMRYIIKDIKPDGNMQIQDNPLIHLPLEIIEMIGSFCLRDIPKLPNNKWDDLITIARDCVKNPLTC